ncbi:MAG: tRNA (adenosine(37)-N6)-threonylcarbamoyltransferase complex ATPase subunit type 1 TsaE [Bacteroidaceae bacterium]|nr:tRNA (adenosine(37)-N6)-threonylcarbamoyltransferase complex ATPase subunit type 1 TsaE [Bacteroidaceae bacterium]
MEIKIENTQNLTVAAQKFVDEMGENRVFAFYGKMGAGKTTFIKAICEALGVEDVVTSPTFAIVNEYADAKGEPVYHFDFYRIKNLREAYDIGCEEYFYSGYPCFIEWPELVEELLPEDTVSVRIEVLENEGRIVTIA